MVHVEIRYLDIKAVSNAGSVNIGTTLNIMDKSAIPSVPQVPAPPNGDQTAPVVPPGDIVPPKDIAPPGDVAPPGDIAPPRDVAPPMARGNEEK
ncbi:hypothetical protein J2Z48_003131 [Croceifilum oryzae]|uniref:Uncharacterized protein n=1 Tax=Croceifilum oryzae TaxID=1553429 RepID=A0AAJ1TN53_9BACL|nr:hypothetical protein [Croceifilum oryzae]MDQ0418926.1 hypothetical protein [Croceifilum oryzae]